MASFCHRTGKTLPQPWQNVGNIAAKDACTLSCPFKKPNPPTLTTNPQTKTNAPNGKNVQSVRQ
ncbi:hypothetical protein DXB65_20680 [Bacteroides oleiciplenus]|uniref:Uncharacterized protein n=1 Tax=Bacteroides oleiciplenus TaxID=626931 RepID=A0A3E5B1M7_9BACE|nr:hypothetical protein DXB65_20680 [Bacteroides oleiciplenus]